MAEKLQKEEIKARDISWPVDSMELEGQTYPLVFDLAAFRIAEDIYELEYGRNLNFGEILMQLAAGKLGAIMAILYAALKSGGLDMDWAGFSDKFKLVDIPGVKEKLMANVRKALPEKDGKAAGNEQDPQ